MDQVNKSSGRSVADTSFVSETAALLADFKARLGLQGEDGEYIRRRAVAWTGVAVIHVLLVYLLIASQWLPIDFRLAPEQPSMTWVRLTGQSKTQKPAPPAPVKKSVPQAVMKVVPPTVIKPKEEENNAIDWGLAIGRSLACGASSYEYLSPRQQAACLHRPWLFTYDRHGNIVLEAKARQPQEEKLRNSDIQARERNTTPQCPTYIDPNAPCLSAITGSHP